MANDSLAIKTVAAQCYCKSLHFTLTLKTSDLPLATHICHCSICRRTHGTMCIFHAPLPAGVAPEFVAPSSLDKLTAYRWPGCTSTRYFCSTCGCHMGDVSPEDGEWVISTSIFTSNEPVYQIRSHVFTNSAPGGGMNDFLPRIGDREVKVWNPKEVSEAPEEIKPEYGTNGEERLRFECNCGGVSFSVPRPEEADATDGRMGHYVSPADKRKLIAVTCACDSCRTASGSHVMTWTFLPLSRCEPKIGPDLRLGTMKTITTGINGRKTLRSFCGVCGATVFFTHSGRDSGIVNIAVGLIRAPEGVKAENWLTWRARHILWGDIGERYNEELIKSLAGGMKEWSMSKYGHDGVVLGESM